MRKIRIPILLLLTAVLIAAGALLPRIVAAVQDTVHTNKAGYSDIQSVALEFGESKDQAAVRMMKKLTLEKNMHTLPIDTAEASMTEAEVYEAVEACMDVYVANGLFRWFKDTYRSVEAYLAIDPDNANNISVFWAVHIVKEDDPYHNLFLHLDDETGKIIYLDYVNYEPNETTYTPGEAFTETLYREAEAFTSIYFDQLGLTDMASHAQVEVLERDGDVLELRYTFSDEEYGELTIEFYVQTNGFYIHFPD